MIRRLDAWIGKTLFIPLIIRFCQWRGWSQYKFARVNLILSLVVLLSHFPGRWWEWIFTVILAILLMGNIYMLVVEPDHVMKPTLWVRVACWILTVFDFLIFATSGQWHFFWFWKLFALFADYANTINTIPPLEVKERETAREPALRH